MKKEVIAFLIALSPVASIAGEFSNHCYDKGLHKQEVYGCLDEIEERAKLMIKERITKIQEKASGYGSEMISVSDDDINRMAYSFDAYAKEQCNLIGGYLLGSGAGQESQDCHIKLLDSRIKDLDYILKNYYQ